jgi:cytochrome P450
MLGSFIRHGLTQEEAASEALLQIIAGGDTSAGTLRAVMISILTTPTSYRKLQVEIDDGIKAGKISSPIRDSEARQLPYLQAVIKEGLRLMPPATGASYKEVPPEGDIINGKFIPGGTQIGVSSLAIQLSKKLFGEDADLFRPERWIMADPSKFAQMSNNVDLVFHYGKYQCLGKGVALMEFNKVFVEASQFFSVHIQQKLTISQLLRRFNFSIIRPDRPTELDIAVSAFGLFDLCRANQGIFLGCLGHERLLASRRKPELIVEAMEILIRFMLIVSSTLCA